jgi:hypothetical protein
MTSEQAKRILALYRPKIDANDPQFADALAQAGRDPELARWLEDQSAIYVAVRSKLKDAPVPEDLLDKTLRHRPAVWWTQPWLRLAACLVLLAGVAYFWLGRGPKQPTFDNYRRTMANVVSKYRMSLESSDADRVRTFLANNQAPADYELPKSIARQRLLGCATLSWDGHPVSLLCFRHQNGTDLWLFVRRQTRLKGVPSPTQRVFAEINQVNTASWHQGGNLYLLAIRGDPALLRDSLQ